MISINENINGVRAKKKEQLNKIFPIYNFKPKPKNSIRELLENFEFFKEKNISIIGRVVNNRNTRMFILLREEGYDIQVYISKECLKFDERKMIDNGDVLFISGILKKTHVGEITIFASVFKFAAKCVVSIPDQYFLTDDNKYGIEDRTKYLTLNKDAFNLLKSRFISVFHIRDIFRKNSFIEVETPVLQKLAGGALAKPFKTFYEAEKENFSLRIAPELYLKRLIITGYGKIFEIAKNFRNEGKSPVHNPEFSMLEGYVRDWQINDAIEFTNLFIKDLCRAIINDSNILSNKKICAEILKKEFETIDFFEKLYELIGYEVDVESWDGVEEIAKIFNISSIKEYISPGEVYGDIITKFYIKNKRKDDLINLINHPACISPLSKNTGKIAKRFEVYLFGAEVVDGFEENNDFNIQLETFNEQKALINNEIDFNYIKDMMLGMPHTAGFGIGIDRLISILFGCSNIRDIISFLD